jgi:hypothetical protein
MTKSFLISKKRVAKEILLFWFVIIPIGLAYLFCVSYNFAIDKRRGSLKEKVSDNRIQFDSNEEFLESVFEISFESFDKAFKELNKQHGSHEVIDMLPNFTKKYYPEFYPLLKPVNELNLLSAPRLFHGILIEKADAVNINDILIQSSDSLIFWNNYITNIDVIYNRNKKQLDKLTENHNKEFEMLLKEGVESRNYFKQQYDEANVKNKEFMSKYKRLFFDDIMEILIIVLIGYYVLLYPIRLIIYSIIWSFKTIKKE